MMIKHRGRREERRLLILRSDFLSDGRNMQERKQDGVMKSRSTQGKGGRGGREKSVVLSRKVRRLQERETPEPEGHIKPH